MLSVYHDRYENLLSFRLIWKVMRTLQYLNPAARLIEGDLTVLRQSYIKIYSEIASNGMCLHDTSQGSKKEKKFIRVSGKKINTFKQSKVFC